MLVKSRSFISDNQMMWRLSIFRRMRWKIKNKWPSRPIAPDPPMFQLPALSYAVVLSASLDAKGLNLDAILNRRGLVGAAGPAVVFSLAGALSARAFIRAASSSLMAGDMAMVLVVEARVGAVTLAEVGEEEDVVFTIGRSQFGSLSLALLSMQAG